MMVSLLRVTGSYDRAQEIVDRLTVQRQKLNPFERAWLEYHSATLDGDSQRALSRMRRNFELAPRSILITFGLTRNLLVCGRPHEALSLLRAAFSAGYPWSVDLHSSLELKPLRGHPEFEAILHPEE